jgi:hypothetical protein
MQAAAFGGTMRLALIVLAFSVVATGVTMLAPTAEAMSYCVDNSPDPTHVPDCSYYLACLGQYCMDYPCRYCMPI